MLHDTFFLWNSCYGQTLIVSTYIGETLYAIFLAVLGLVLFAHLIGKVQVLLSSNYAHYICKLRRRLDPKKI
jgi:hypothetical protein